VTGSTNAGSRGRIWIAGGAIAAAAAAAYADSFSGAFVFDDPGSIAGNPTIRGLWSSFSPPAGLTVSGRPVLNLSLAVNDALGGLDPRGFHAVNLSIHILAGLFLFGIVRRTLAISGAARPVGLAFVAALLWTVHPIQTESVTYVIQRAESLMGLFYLLTLYAFVRAAEPGGRSGWLWVSVLACLGGMGTKEVMASAPLIVLLYDRTFVSGGFAAAWRARRTFYLFLGATWVALAWLLASTGGDRGGTLGFGVGVPWGIFEAAQMRAVVHYLSLCFWPHPLVLDYGGMFPGSFWEVLPCVPVVALLVGGTAWALVRRPAFGFLGCWFLAILAPTSLVPGVRQTMAEHRMYLPLAAVIVIVVLAADRALRGRPGIALALGLAAAAACGSLTAARNRDYRDPIGLWRDTVVLGPANAFAHFNLAEALARAGRAEESIAEYREAVRLRPDFAAGRQALGVALADAGRLPEATGEYEAALRLEPDNPDLEFDLGNALAQGGRSPEAIPHLERAVRLKPDFPEAWLNLGNALLAAGRPQDAISCYRRALRLRPDYPDARNNLVVTLRAVGRPEEADEAASGR
jgi:hypothetical protein